MSKIQGKPFIELVVDTLGDLKTDFLDLVNGSDKTPEFRSLINASAKITDSDKGKVQYVVLETWSKTYTGYLIYNNTYCVLVAFSSNTQALTMLKIDVAKQTFITVKEYLDINELRRYLEEADEHVVATEIDSGSEPANKVLVSDGDGGAEWKDTMDTITPETVEEGDAVQLFGFNSQGQLVKDAIPEGITVDQTIVEDSENAVAGGAVYDLKEQVDALEEELETKANVDGNYPTMTVGMADNLTPYDESAGDDQNEPFSLQATGTGNGTQPDFATGSGALMKEKQGNSVVVNQKLQNPNITTNSNWITESGTLVLDTTNHILSFTATQQHGAFRQGVDIITNHKYLVSFLHKGEVGSFYIYTNGGDYAENLSSHTSFTCCISLIEATANASALIFQDSRASDWTEQQFKDIYLIDLTQWFGSNGDIPQDLLDHPDHFFRYYQGSLAYNEGTLVNANGRYLKTIGRNQWDEEWELGGLVSGCINSKNFIKVIPNAEYYFYNSSLQGYDVYFYDTNKELISYGGVSNPFTIPSNCSYIKFRMGSGYGTTYNHDITISIYYDGESGYDQYYPYEVLTNNDTGTETLRSAGSVKDYKTPDGMVHRLVGVVDLGSLTYQKVALTEGYKWQASLPDDALSVYNADLICSKYQKTTVWSINNESNINKVIGVEPNYLAIKDSDFDSYDAATFKTAMSGVMLYYELATSATEQGTSFSENVAIDDFGSMDFGGTNNVPQGNLIFYPVDYKAFVDTLYKYTDGAPSKIALKSDLAVVDNKIGAKLPECPTTTDGTYVLKATVSSGTVVYSWVLEE